MAEHRLNRTVDAPSLVKGSDWVGGSRSKEFAGGANEHLKTDWVYEGQGLDERDSFDGHDRFDYDR